MKDSRLRVFNVNNGLSQNTIRVIYEDKYGLIWLGTNDGLNRFESGHLEIYYSNPKEPGSLQNDKITDIEEDNNDRLWLSTYGGGLAYYDYKTDKFSIPLIKYKKNQNLIQAIAVDTIHKEIWAATDGGGFFCYNYATNKKIDFWYEREDDVVSTEFAEVLFNKGKIYAGNSVGQILVLDSTHKIINTCYASESIVAEIKPYGTRLLVATMSNDYFLYDPMTNTKRQIIVNKFNTTQHSIITSIAKVTNTQFIITSQSNIQFIKISNDTIYVEKIINTETSNVEGNSFLCALVDSKGTEWFGTNGYGVYFRNKYFDLFSTTKHNNTQYGLTFSSVRTIHQFGDELWVGGYGGIDRINLKTRKVKPVTVKIQENMSNLKSIWLDYLYNDNIYNFYQDKSNEDLIWIGTEGYGAYLYSKSKNKFKFFGMQTDNDYTDFITSVFNIANYGDTLVLGTSEGVYIYEPKQKILKLLIYLNHNFQRKKMDVKSLFIDKDNLYIVISGIGAFVCNMRQTWATPLSSYYPELDSNIFTYSNSIRKYKDKILLATKEQGILILNLNDSTYKQYSYSNGLINNCVYEVLDDNQGNLWVSTNRGISMINLKSDIITNFNSTIFGLNGEYNLNASYKANDSLFFFGGVYGIVEFNPERVAKLKFTPNLIVKSVELNHGEQVNNYYFVGNDTINVDFIDDLVEVNFITNEYFLTTNLNYEYRLNGGKWKLVKNNKANITGLKNGENRIDIRIRNESNRLDETKFFYINISIPFWETNWFIGICILISLYLAYYLYQKNVKKLKSNILKFGRENRALQSYNSTLNKKFDLLSSNTSNVVWQTDKNFNILYHSPNLFNYYNISEYGTNLNLSDIYISADLIQLKEDILDNKSELKKLERKLFHKNSNITEKKFSEVKIKLNFDDKGNLIGLIGVVSDTKEREKAQQQLQEKEELFSTLVNTTLEPMVITSWEGEILFANNEAKDVLEVAQEDMYEKTLFDFSEDPYNNELRKQVYIVRKGDNFNKQQFSILVNKKEKTIEGNGVKIIYYGKEVFLFTFRDVTERINLINELTSAKIDAERSSELKTMYLSNLTHELKTPINAISGFTDILQLNANDKANKSNLDSIKRSTILLLQLINDLLSYTKAESGQLEIRPVPTELSKVISDIENIFMLELKKKNLVFNKEIKSNGINQLLNLDQLKFKQILINLINNAIKYTDEGSIKLTITMNKVNNAQVNLKLILEDTGRGIPNAKLDEIFTAFKQVNFSDENNGFGLGLAIVKRILDSMNGNIEVSSIINEGTKFIVTIRNINLILKKSSGQSETKQEDIVDKFIRRDNNLFHYSYETLQALFFQMEGIFIHKLEEIKKNYLLNDIVDFAEQINQLATERGVEFLINYSNALLEASKSIEVEKINYLLEKFYNLVELVKQLIKKRNGTEQRKNINS